MHGFGRAGGATKTTVGAAEGGGGEHRQKLAAGRVMHRALGINQPALARAFVDDASNLSAPDHLALGGWQAADDQTLLPMHQANGVDARGRVFHPHANVAQDHRQCRQCQQVFFIDEAQLSFVQRVGAQADAQCVQHGVALCVAMAHVLERPRHKLGVVNRHGVAPL